MRKYCSSMGILIGSAGVFLCSGGFILWLYLSEGNIGGGVLVFTIFALFSGLYLFKAMIRLKLEPSGVTEYIGPFILKHLPANRLLTIVKCEIFDKCDFKVRRSSITVLAFSPLPVRELEAQGEARLRKHPLYRHSLKFREGRSDWGDLCLGGGFHLKGMLFIEYSEERKELIHSLYPHVEFRETKRMEDPIQAKNERSM